MKELLKGLPLLYMSIFILFSVIGLFYAFNTWLAPAQEELRYEVYEESRAKVLGDVRNLDRLRLQYELADSPEHERVLTRTILNEYSTVNKSRLEEINPDLKEWIDELQKQYVNQNQMDRGN